MKIYCLGDSLTAGYGVAPHKNWVSLLGSRGKNLWINGGISGDTSPGLLARLQTAAIPQKPDMVIWMGGFNDILLTGSADLAKACVMAFVNHCAAADHHLHSNKACIFPYLLSVAKYQDH